MLLYCILIFLSSPYFYNDLENMKVLLYSNIYHWKLFHIYDDRDAGIVATSNNQWPQLDEALPFQHHVAHCFWQWLPSLGSWNNICCTGLLQGRTCCPDVGCCFSCLQLLQLFAPYGLSQLHETPCLQHTVTVNDWDGRTDARCFGHIA